MTPIWFAVSVILLAVEAQTVYNVQYVTNACVAKTLSSIVARGFLRCGCPEGDPIFGYVTGNDRAGFDVSMCKAVAAALFPNFNTSNIQYTSVDTITRFSLIQSGQVDMVAYSTTNTVDRVTRLGLKFSPIMLYDGTGIAARSANSTVNATSQLGNATVCVSVGTSTIDAVTRFAVGKNITVRSEFSRLTLYQSLNNGTCIYIADDMSALASNMNMTGSSDNSTARILQGPPISKEPLAPFVSANETALGVLLDVVINGLLLAEEKGVFRANATGNSAFYPSTVGQNLTLASNFMEGVIRTVGNYGEIYEAYVGTKIPRASGINRLVRDGGIMYPTD